MATFAYAVTQRGISVGNKRWARGTYTNNSSSTGGDVKTGLSRVDMFIPIVGGAAVDADAPAVNETLPLASGDVTIVTTADSTGYWLAIGT